MVYAEEISNNEDENDMMIMIMLIMMLMVMMMEIMVVIMMLRVTACLAKFWRGGGQRLSSAPFTKN